MKKTRKILALLLSFSVILSLLCVPVFAEEAQSENALSKYTKGTGYVAFGDSFTRGYGASDNWVNEEYLMDNTNNKNCRNVTGSYPLLLASNIGCNTPNDITDKTATYWPIAQNAVSTAFILDLMGIEDNFCDKDSLYSPEYYFSTYGGRYKTDLYYFGDPLSVAYGGESLYGKTGSIMSCRTLVNDASLISIQLGMSDVLYRAKDITIDSKNVDLSDTAALTAVAEDFVAEMYKGYDYWKTSYPLLLDYIKNNNPDCEVVLVGAMNPLQNVTISDDIAIPVGTAISTLTALMNQNYKKWAEEYGYIYVDISNVEAPADVDNVSFLGLFTNDPSGNSGLLTHPTPNGYAQIARLISTALEDKATAEKAEQERITAEKLAAEFENKTTVKVELGSFKSVDYVLIDDKATSDYTLEDSVLSVKTHSMTAKTLTVAAIDSKGKVSVSVFQLAYNDGYDSYRMYTNNDVGTTIKNSITKAVTTIKNAFSKLFGKK